MSSVPLTQLARGDRRNAAASAISSTVPRRSWGNSVLANAANASGSSMRRRSHEPPSKRIEPGLRALTRMRSGPSSRPSETARWISAAFAAAYCAFGWGREPEMEAMTSAAPPPAL